MRSLVVVVVDRHLVLAGGEQDSVRHLHVLALFVHLAVHLDDQLLDTLHPFGEQPVVDPRVMDVAAEGPPRILLAAG